LIIRTPIEYCQPARSRRSNTFVFQNPESARSSLTPLAPARSTRAVSSSQKRLIPFCVFADPLRRRICSASRGIGAGREDRVIAQQLGATPPTVSVDQGAKYRAAGACEPRCQSGTGTADGLRPSAVLMRRCLRFF